MSRELLQQCLDLITELDKDGVVLEAGLIFSLRDELAKPDEKPEWQELYKDEVYAILNDGEEWSSLEFAQAISDLLREKNT
jgi:hypothetical protein